MTKKELVAKIAKEQNLDPNKLERMNMETLHKMDKVVPDTDGDLLGSAELPSVPSVPNTLPADQTGSGTLPTDATGLPEDGSEDLGTGSVDDAGGLATEHDHQSGTPDTTSDAGDATQTGEQDSGSPAVSTEVGTVIVGEMTGTMELPPQETPTGSTEVASEEGSDVHGTRTDAVVGHVILGYHPVTEEPVYADEQ
jgi:hypothetical protein